MSILRAYLDKDTAKPLHINDYNTKEHKGHTYCCDGHEVIAKKGSKMLHHYAHKKKDDASDNCSRELGEWHRYMQNRIEEKYIEIIMNNGNKKHIADVKTPENLVIEFQKSIISPQIINERESYYKKYTSGIIWVFYIEHDIEIIHQSGDLIAFKIIKGSKYFLSANERSFLDQGKRGYIELLKINKKLPIIIGKLWSFSDFDKTFLSSCLKSDADTRFERPSYNIDFRNNENQTELFISNITKNISKLSLLEKMKSEVKKLERELSL